MYPCPIPVINVSANTHPLPRLFFFQLVLGNKPFFSLSKYLPKTFSPSPNFLAVTFNRSTPNSLAT